MGDLLVENEPDEVAPLLAAWNAGDVSALQRLMPLVIDDLRRLAARCFKNEEAEHTLQPTALVNELYLRLAGYRSVSWKNRTQFFAFTAQVMRRILVDHARIRGAQKRGDGLRPIPLEKLPDIAAPLGLDLLDLDEALTRLGALDPRAARVVELKVFVGLTTAEIAEVLEVTDRTVKRDWKAARVWLHREMEL